MGSCYSRAVGAYRAAEISNVITDRTFHPNGGRRGIIFCHGVSSGGDDQIRAGNSADKILALVAAGYPVIAADLCGAAYSPGQNWANDDHIAAIAAAWAYLKAPGGAKVDKVGLYCASMGAAGALAWARANLASCFAVAGVIPVLDVDANYQGATKTSFRSQIETAYAIAYPTAIPSIATHSPVAFGSADLAGLPVRVWASSTDTTAATPAEATTWGGKGATLTVTDIGTNGHDASFADAQQVLQFFDDNGGRT